MRTANYYGTEIKMPSWEGGDRIGWLTVLYNATGRIHVRMERQTDGSPDVVIPLDTKSACDLIHDLATAVKRGHYDYASKWESEAVSEQRDEIAKLKRQLAEAKKSRLRKWLRKSKRLWGQS